MHVGEYFNISSARINSVLEIFLSHAKFDWFLAYEEKHKTLYIFYFILAPLGTNKISFAAHSSPRGPTLGILDAALEVSWSLRLAAAVVVVVLLAFASSPLGWTRS